MKTISLVIMIILYIVAGLNHFWHPEFYKKIMPPYVPWHYEVIFVSGIAEIAFALLLIPASTRFIAAWLIIIMLIVIFPANIQMTINYWNADKPGLWLTIVRLFLQGVLIWWAYSLRK